MAQNHKLILYIKLVSPLSPPLNGPLCACSLSQEESTASKQINWLRPLGYRQGPVRLLA
uniref:Uncharacterized protein n=1 Tax=Phlebia radiata TaxID=5308 RepID=L8B997_PHLRA|nr:hypothetical protein PRA_mt0182 [Phlebia radiata]CCE89245.1 hypothetical protein PRA_mt0182 [Phlebia radiata]